MDAEWLKAQFTLNPKKTKSALAHLIGLEPPAISKIIGGKRQIKASEYVMMRNFFGLPSDGEKAVSHGHRDSNPMNLKNTLEEEGDNNGDSQWHIPADLLTERTTTPPDKIKTFKVLENTMAPQFRLGDNVIVDLSDQTPSPPGTFIITDGYGHLIRQCELMTGSEPPKVQISASQKDFQSQILEFGEFHIIGRVIAKLQWL